MGSGFESQGVHHKEGPETLSNISDRAFRRLRRSSWLYADEVAGRSVLTSGSLGICHKCEGRQRPQASPIVGACHNSAASPVIGVYVS